MSKGARNRANRASAMAKLTSTRPPLTREERWIMESIVKSAVDDGERQLIRFFDGFALDLAAMVMWLLHVEFGFEAEELRLFYARFRSFHAEMTQFYELDDNNNGWICRTKLKSIGVDIEKWEAENELDAKKDPRGGVSGNESTEPA